MAFTYAFSKVVYKFKYSKTSKIRTLIFNKLKSNKFDTCLIQRIVLHVFMIYFKPNIERTTDNYILRE